jgi:predicted transcriptional regulator
MSQPEIKSYFVQLAELAVSKDADLKEAFLDAGVPDSTYYRVLNGRDLHYRTALKVAGSLSEPDQEASVLKEHDTNTE